MVVRTPSEQNFDFEEMERETHDRKDFLCLKK
jgi:hypothetical protein